MSRPAARVLDALQQLGTWRWLVLDCDGREVTGVMSRIYREALRRNLKLRSNILDLSRAALCITGDSAEIPSVRWCAEKTTPIDTGSGR